MIAYALLAVRRRPELRRRRHRPAARRRQPLGRRARLFVAEACEYDRSFHNLRPKVALITNIEEDHLDCYTDIDEIVESFRTFAELVPAGRADHRQRQRRAASARRSAGCRRAIEYGRARPRGRRGARASPGIENGCYRGAGAATTASPSRRCSCRVAGEHNLFNATMAVAACARVRGRPGSGRRRDRRRSRGVDRRMTEMGTCQRRDRRRRLRPPPHRDPRDAQGPARAVQAEAAVLRLPAAPAQPHAVPARRLRDQLRAGGRDDRAGHLLRPRQRGRAAAASARADLVERINAQRPAGAAPAGVRADRRTPARAKRATATWS